MGNGWEQRLASAGKKVRADMRALYPQLRDGLRSPAPTVPPVPEDDLDGVMFASSAAHDLADKEGLTWSDFTNSKVAASSALGYRKADVESIIMERDHAD